MKKKFFLLSIMILFSSPAVFAEGPYVTEIALETSERWWGVDGEGRSWACHADKNNDAQNAFRTGMMVSSAGRYLWSAEPVEVRQEGSKLIVTSRNERVEAQKAGKTLREAYIVCIHKNLPSGRRAPALELMTRPVYKPALRPDVTWGQEELLEYARRIVSEGLPLGTLVVPEGWCSANVSFAFSQELFPDPAAMIAELHGMGFKVMLTVTPRTPSSGRVFSDAYRNGHIMPGRESGRFGTFDLADGTFFASFRSGFEALKAKYAFDGYRFECAYPGGGNDTDGGATDNANAGAFRLNWEKFIDGADMYQTAVIWNEAYSAGVSGNGANREKYALDNLIAASLSGDMSKAADCGVSGSTDRERAAHMLATLFYPVVTVDFAPWELREPEFYDHLKIALAYRASLSEYIDDLVRDAAVTGEPFVRHMEYQFPRQGFSDCDSQFMLGPRFLAVPRSGDSDKCMVRLPKGHWTDKYGNKFKGPLVMETDCRDGFVYYVLLK